MSDIHKYATYFSEAKNLYNEISDTFEDIENGVLTISTDRFAFVKLGRDVKNLMSVLSKINITQIGRDIKDTEFVEKLKNKIQLFYESAEYIQKRLMGYEYIDDLKVPVSRYFKKLSQNPDDYKKWAKHPEQLTNKFIEMLTHPDNIDTYINQIKRMALGTMSQKEFQKIYEASKHKMMPLPEKKFESFSEYKLYTYET
jgi:hypothetical protein